MRLTQGAGCLLLSDLGTLYPVNEVIFLMDLKENAGF